VAVEQSQSEGRFKIAQGGAYTALRGIQDFGGPGDALGMRDSNEGPQVA
jgi:hypothetical protein